MASRSAICVEQFFHRLAEHRWKLLEWQIVVVGMPIIATRVLHVNVVVGMVAEILIVMTVVTVER